MLAEDAVRLAARRAFKHVPPFAGPVMVDVVFYMPIPRSLSRKKREALGGTYHDKKPDCDNLGKLVCDALIGIAYKDDGQVAVLHVRKGYFDLPYTYVQVIALT